MGVALLVTGGQELVSRADAKLLKVFRAMKIGENYLAVQILWFRKFVTESLCDAQDCFVGSVKFKNEMS